MSTSRHGAKSKCPDLTDSRARLFACIKPLELDEHRCFCMFIIIIIVSKILFPHALKCSFYAMMLKLIREFHAALCGNSLKNAEKFSSHPLFFYCFPHQIWKNPPERRGKLPCVFNQPMRHVFPLAWWTKNEWAFCCGRVFFAPFACEWYQNGRFIVAWIKPTNNPSTSRRHLSNPISFFR